MGNVGSSELTNSITAASFPSPGRLSSGTWLPIRGPRLPIRIYPVINGDNLAARAFPPPGHRLSVLSRTHRATMETVATRMRLARGLLAGSLRGNGLAVVAAHCHVLSLGYHLVSTLHNQLWRLNHAYIRRQSGPPVDPVAGRRKRHDSPAQIHPAFPLNPDENDYSRQTQLHPSDSTEDALARGEPIMNRDDYVDEIVWQLEFQGIVVDSELHGIILAYWRENVSPVAVVGIILGIPTEVF